MANGKSPYSRIVARLPELQDQIRMVDQLSSSTAPPQQDRWAALAELLGDLYSQLQHQKQVTVYRTGKRSPANGRRGK